MMCLFPPLRIIVSIMLLCFCFLHKLIALIVIRNVLGLPDYVLGELLANSNIIRNGRLIISAEMEEKSDYYETDGDLSKMSTDEVDLSETSKLIRFTPHRLYFKQHSVGIPYVQKVVVENLQEDASVQMLSISGNTVHFHCSFFEDKVIHSEGNTSFDVVFLARQEGPVSNTLYIHTSVGSFKYQVSAVGVPNPYRLRPLVGAKVPVNSSYSPMIHIYNPHSATLQLTEMYSTGGGLHLELPNGNNEGPKELWQIPPFETKAVMKANFLARSEKNHTAYIRIKTNASDYNISELILPVEVEVSSAPGIYSPVDLIDFGVTRSTDEPLEMSLQILNAGTKAITIQNVIATPVNEALDIVFSSTNPVRVPPNIYHSTDIAKLRLQPSKITSCWKQCSGKIVVKSKNNQYKLTIPYQVTLISGHLSYNQSQTQFYIPPSIDANTENKRILKVTSYFNFSLVVHSISLPDEAKPYFKVTLIESNICLSPNETHPLVIISFTPSQQLTRLQTYFRLHTNISHLDVLLSAYSGKLDVFVPQSMDQTTLDFGTIGLREGRSMVFSVVNNNPVDVRLKNWGCNMSEARMELIGIEEGNITAVAHKTNYSTLEKKNYLRLKPKHFAIFKLHLNGFKEETTFYGENFVETDFEVLRVSLVGAAIEGSLSSESVVIGNSFPGRVSSQNVKISSSFSSKLYLKSIAISPKDETRFTFKPSSSPAPLTKTAITLGNNTVGKLYFDPYKACAPSKNCYTGLETSKEVGHLWLLGLALHPDTGYIDKELHKLLYSRWTSLLPYNRLINASLNIETESGHNIKVGVQSTLHWPRLIYGGKNYLKFPISRMGNTTVKEITLENPSSQPILVQVVLLSDYPNPDSAIQAIGSMNLWPESDIKQVETSPKSFQLMDANGSPSSPSLSQNSAPVPDQSSNIQRIKNTFSVTPAASSITMVMPVGYRTKISVGFTPQYPPGYDFTNPKNVDQPSSASTFLLIRNNLTIFDAIHISGEGGSGLLKIGNQLPGLTSILSFDVQEKHLSKSCKKQPAHSSIEPVFTVHKSFNLVNYGKLPIRINGFLIGPPLGAIATVNTGRKVGQPIVLYQSMGANKYLNLFIGHSLCQGFGFKVLNCDMSESKSTESSSKKDIQKKGKKSSSKENSFILRPNESKKVHIAFTPDFSLSRTSAILTVLTDDYNMNNLPSLDLDPLAVRNLGKHAPIQYSLIASVPKHLLTACADALPRPYWELILYYTLVIFMVCLHLLSVVSAFFDGARILNFSFYPAIMLTKTIPINALDSGEQMDNIELIRHIVNSNGKDKYKKQTETKSSKQLKKPVKEASKPKKPPSSNLDGGLEEPTAKTALSEPTQSWTSYLKGKFSRRDSSGSDKSSTAGSGRRGKEKKKADLKRKETTTATKEKLNGDAVVSNGNTKKRLNAKSWFTSLASVSVPNRAPEPPPLPSFPSAFDDDDKLNLKGKGKKSKTPQNSTASSVNNSIAEPNLTLELPYKPAKQAKATAKKGKQDSNKSVKCNSQDGGMETWSNSSCNEDATSSKAIWDSPITMFDTEKAMSELVKQTEFFAIKDKKTISKPAVSKVAKEPGETKSALCSFDSLSSYPEIPAALGTDLITQTFQQEIQRPKASLTPPGWRLSSPLGVSPSFRSSTPPVVPSLNLPFDETMKHRSTGLANLLERPGCSTSSSTSPSSWIADSLLDTELSLLKDHNHSSSWGHLGASRTNEVSAFSHKTDHIHRDQIPQQSRLSEWTRFGGVELGTSRLWDTPGTKEAIGSLNDPVTSSSSSQSIWNENAKPKNIWGTAGETSTTDSYGSWLNSASTSTAPASSSNFTLFGKSPWSPLTTADIRKGSLAKEVSRGGSTGGSASQTWSLNLLTYPDGKDAEAKKGEKRSD